MNICQNIYTGNNINNKIRILSFKGILADGIPNFGPKYSEYTTRQIKIGNHDFLTIKSCMTKIFRELHSQVTLAKMINPHERTKIHILGCSDGSEAFAYGIIFRTIMGKISKKNVEILGVDLQKALIEIAKSHCIVCTDKEKSDFVNNNLLKYSKDIWNKYIKKIQRPKNFDTKISQYPLLRYLEKNEVEKQYIGCGMNWCRIDSNDLPKITFKCGDMFSYLKSNPRADNVIFVIANSGGYVSCQGGIEKFIDIFRQIKLQNNNKNIYVVLGDGELSYDRIEHNKISQLIQELGFKKLYDIDNCAFPNISSRNKIYKLCR